MAAPNIVNKDDTGAPGLSKGIVVTGVTTSTSGEFTSSAVIGYGVTINGTGIQLAAGIVTGATYYGDGSGLTGLNIPAGFTELDAALFN